MCIYSIWIQYNIIIIIVIIIINSFLTLDITDTIILL